MKHHYVPQFLLRRWANQNGKLQVFSRRQGRIICTERAPRSTGFVDDLYAIAANIFGIQKDLIERKLFGKIDNDAAVALGHIEAHQALNVDQQIAWLFFLSSLRVRQPDMLRFLRTTALNHVRRKIAAQRNLSSLDIAETPEAAWFEQNFPGNLEARSLTSWLPRMITHDGVLCNFENLLWFTREFSAEAPKLLLADMPLHWDTGLEDPDLVVQLPLGPDRILLGTRTESAKLFLNQISVPELVERANRATLASSVEFIWASERDAARSFIEANIDIVGANFASLSHYQPWQTESEAATI